MKVVRKTIIFRLHKQKVGKLKGVRTDPCYLVVSVTSFKETRFLKEAEYEQTPQGRYRNPLYIE